MKFLPIVLLGISFLLAGCGIYRQRDETLERVRRIDLIRLDLLYRQLRDIYNRSEEHEFYREWDSDSIPDEFRDLRPRKIRMRPGYIYFSFWFCMDEGIQYDIFGFDGKREPEIILSWGEPGKSDYHEVTVWKSPGSEKPLTGKELIEFLGPISSSLMSWTKRVGPDFDVYIGQARSPLSGCAGFYLGGHPPFEGDPAAQVIVGQLGIYPAKWYKTILPNGWLKQEAVIPLDEYWKPQVWVEASDQQTAEKLLGELDRLPTFNSKPIPIEFRAPYEDN